MNNQKENGDKQFRNIFSDGCYDVVHFGHANEMRQAKDICNCLKVGVHNDEEIAVHKGPTFFNFHERLIMVKAVRWVDEVIPNAPFENNLDFVDANDCDFVVHGDDITLTAEGVDCYLPCKLAKRYHELKRTFNVSTTDIIQRIIVQTNNHVNCNPKTKMAVINKNRFPREELLLSFDPYITSIFESFVKSWINPYSCNSYDKKALVPGVFDLFHPGMLQLLENIKNDGYYIIIALFDDQLSNQLKSGIRPIMNLYERSLSLLACRYVDELIISVDYPIHMDFIKSLKVDKVFCGSNTKHLYGNIECLEVLEHNQKHQTSEIIQRIFDMKNDYVKRNEKKLNKQ